MKQRENYCTPIPARRISENGTLELRVASQNAVKIQVLAEQPGSRTMDCGLFSLANGLVMNKIVPDMKGILGDFTIKVHFLDVGGQIIDSWSQGYQIVGSNVHSTCLLDGCWVSIYHWSDDEARYFNPALKVLDDAGWKQQVYSMHKIGVTSVLVQNVFHSPYYVGQHDRTADTYDGQAFYDSRFYPGRAELVARDPLEAILSAADECGMAVFPGVGLYAWFDFSSESLKWHKRVTCELHKRYGHHPSFYGWYMSEEIFGALYFEYPQVPDERWKEIAYFFQEYKRFVWELTPTKPVALAPNNIHMDHYRDEWREILRNLDILIPFAFARSDNNIPQIAEMCGETGTHFWVDMEIFRNPFDEGLRPKAFDELLREIHQYDMLEQVYGYQYTGLLNEPGKRMGLGLPETEEVYAQYEKYYHDLIRQTVNRRKEL